jgi:ribonuclease Z
MQITMLGTGAMVPTKDRNAQGIFLDYNGEGILFDCGEGTQRQMNIAGINRHRIKKIFITHWHGDHIGGLLPLLETLSNKESEHKITIFGPKDTSKRIDYLTKTVDFKNNKLEIEIVDLNPNLKEKVYENEDYYVEAAFLDHSVPCLGYSIVEKDKRRMKNKELEKYSVKGRNIGLLQKGETVEIDGKEVTPEMVSYIEKGKKLTVILDTYVCETAIMLAENADFLICECTYTQEYDEKARQYKHLTTENAAFIANQANAQKLLLTHFSQRYKSTDKLYEEIKSFFPESQLAFDLMKIKV